MGDGIDVVNAIGNKVIDSDYRNFKLFAEGSSYNPAGVIGTLLHTANHITFTPRQAPPLVAVRPGATWVSCFMEAATSSVTFYTDPKQTSIPYALFDEDGAQWDAGNDGVQVFDSNGDVVFDSRYRFLKVVDVITLGAFGETAKTAVHTNAPNAFYLLGLAGCSGYEGFDVGVGAFIGPFIRQISNTQIEYVSSYFLGGNSSSSYGGLTPAGTHVVVCSISD